MFLTVSNIYDGDFHGIGWTKLNLVEPTRWLVFFCKKKTSIELVFILV